MPISRALAEEHVKQQTRRLLRYRQRSAWAKYLVHTTHVSNAVNIIKNQVLHSRNEAPEFHDIANQGALEAYTGSHDYARLYFRPKNPFHIRTEGIKCLTDPYRAPFQASVPVALIFDLPSVITLPGVKFTAGNIQKASNVELDGDISFRELDFDAIYHDDYLTAENKTYIMDRRMAEVMVPNSLPLKPHLRMIAFRTAWDLEAFNHFLRQEAISHDFNTIVEQVNASLFMHWGLYITELSFLKDQLAMKFHFPRSRPTDNTYKIFVRQHLAKGGYRSFDQALQLTSAALAITNFASVSECWWEIYLEDVLAFCGRLPHAESKVFG